jgi:hypothetical protein
MFVIPFRILQPRGKPAKEGPQRPALAGSRPQIPPILGFLGGFFAGKAQNPQNLFSNCPPKTAFLRGQFFSGYGTVQTEEVLRRMQGSVAVHKSIATAPVDSIYKDSIRWSGLQVQRISKPVPSPKSGGTNRKEHPMKELNRREFLTLSGAAVVALSLAGCGGPSAPPAPPAPTGKEAELVAAINKVWKKKFDAGLVTHEQLILNQEAQEAIKIQGGIFENAKEPVHKLTMEDMQKLVGIQEWKTSLEKKYDLGGAAGISEPSTEREVSLTFEYSCEDAVVQKFVDKIMGYSLSRKAEFISIYCPVVQGKTYMIATVFWNKKA